MTTIVDLLEDGAGGAGTFHILPDAPVPMARLWSESVAASQAICRLAGTGGAVGALLTNSLATIRAAFGVWLSGNTLVSLPTRAPRQDAGEWRKHVSVMCALSGVSVVLTPDDLVSELVGLELTPVGYGELLARLRSSTGVHGSGRLIQFTSGSTSAPKGVVLSGTALAQNVLAMRDALELGNQDLTISWLPLSHDMGLVGMLLSPWAAAAPRFGGRGGVIMPPQYFIRDPSRWLGACSDFGGTVTTVPTFALDLAVRTGRRSTDLNLAPLRICMIGAERVRADSVRGFVAAFREAGLRDEVLCPAYGMAENGLAVTMVRPSETWTSTSLPDSELSMATEVVSTGRPLDEVSLRIEASTGVAVADGEAGEVVFTSPSLLDEYLGAAAPWTDDGWFRTADVGFIQGGELYVVGRADDTLIIEGRNVYPEDLESAFEPPDVRPNSVAAIAWEDRGAAVVAEVKRSARDLDRTAEMIMKCVTRRTGVVVSAVYFVQRGALCRTSSGKLQRRKIARDLRAGRVEVLAKFGR